MLNISKRLIKRMLNYFGLDIIRISKDTKFTLLGLKKLPIQTIIDVGANTGQFAKYISNLFPKSDIYCFEPLPGPFKVLNQWASKKNGKVLAFNYAR